MSSKEREQKLKEQISSDIFLEADSSKIQIIKDILDNNYSYEEMEKLKKNIENVKSKNNG